MSLDRHQIAYYQRLIADSGIVEVRLLGDRVESGLFDNANDLMACISKHQNHGKVYTTLNRPGIHIQATNHMGTQALRDADISEIVRIPFDLDPVRGTNMPSTYEEMAYALDARARLVASLTGRGWPMPILATSGNGGHAIYRTKLPANQETREMLDLIFKTLRNQFTDEQVSFDVTVRNAARIFRAYGTLNAKGDCSSDRPHRIAEVRHPIMLQILPTRKIAALADEFARRNEHCTPASAPNIGSTSIAGSGDYGTLNVVSWFLGNGLYRGRSQDAGKHYVTCPWHDEHTTASPASGSDTVIWEADGGWPGFFCSHSHCAGRGIRDVIAQVPGADGFCSSNFKRRPK